MATLEIGLIQTHLRIALRLAEQLQSPEEAHLVLTHLDGARELLLALHPAGGSLPPKRPDGATAGVGAPRLEGTLPSASSAPAIEPTSAPVPPTPATSNPSPRPTPAAEPVRPARAVPTPSEPATPPSAPPKASTQTPQAPVEAPRAEPRNAAAASKGDRLVDAYAHRGVRNESFAQPGNLVEAKRAAIASVARAMSVNDRLLFRNELFQGDNVAFEQALQLIDAAPSLAKAMEVVHACYQGPADSPVFQAFVQLIERRHNQ